MFRPMFDSDKFKKPSPFYGYSHDQYLISSIPNNDNKKNVNHLPKQFNSKNTSNMAFDNEDLKQSDKNLKR